MISYLADTPKLMLNLILIYEYPILKEVGFDYSSTAEEPMKIDLLVGADQYWNLVNGEVKRCNNGGLVVLNTRLGWILSDPIKVRGNVRKIL